MTCDRLERDELLGHLGEEMQHVDQCPDCQAKLAGYKRLTDLLAGESARPLPHRWKERTLARLQHQGRRRRAAVALGVAGAAAAAVIALLVIRPPREQSGVFVQIKPGPTQWRADPQPRLAHRDDLLHLSSPPATAEHVELRVYHDAREVVVRCPGEAAPTCRRRDGRLEVTLQLSTGEYQIVWLVSPSPLPEPSGDFDADVRAARRAGAEALESEPVHVD